MTGADSNIKKQVKAFCAQIGADPLLVQGAGGNVSWKDNGTLWVKASGTWLENAEKQEMFLPVDLEHLKTELSKSNFSVAPRVISDAALKPSIETLLHAIMPDRIVVHLHAVEVIAHLIRSDFNEYLEALCSEGFKFELVDYCKPGADLAQSVYSVLVDHPSINVLLLKNHGLVLSSNTIREVRDLLEKIIALSRSLLIPNYCGLVEIQPVPEKFRKLYQPLGEKNIQQLALKPLFFDRLNKDWALYPDHVVFLGPNANTYNSWEAFDGETSAGSQWPDLLFIGGCGVYVRDSFSSASVRQLQCYAEAIIRQPEGVILNSLTSDQVSELLNWDSEKYRQMMRF
jgi:rhamnose utilization protein RhaD (predicted bifunctional aldolase and dehydrogenase)